MINVFFESDIDFFNRYGKDFVAIKSDDSQEVLGVYKSLGKLCNDLCKVYSEDDFIAHVYRKPITPNDVVCI